MKKVIIVGPTGSGKSTLAQMLSEKLKLPYIQLDELFWKPNWQWSTDEEFFIKIQSALEINESWIIDGNYYRTHHLTWPLADTVIWIDLPFWLVFYQNLKRSIVRAFTRKELWPNTGNKESFFRLFSKDSILKWLIQTYPIMKTRYEQAFSSPANSHIHFYRLKSRKDILQFLSEPSISEAYEN